jgi:hypothetical protein
MGKTRQRWPARAAIWLQMSAVQARLQLGWEARPWADVAAPSDARPCATPTPRRPAPKQRRSRRHAARVRDLPLRVQPLKLLRRHPEIQSNQRRSVNFALKREPRAPRRLVKFSQRPWPPFLPRQFRHRDHACILPRSLALAKWSRRTKPTVKRRPEKTRKGVTALGFAEKKDPRRAETNPSSTAC